MSRVALALALGFVLSGCRGDDCESLCKDWVENRCCEKNDFEGCIDDENACQKNCDETARLAKNSGCEPELAAWDDCAANLDDICDDATVCTSTDDEELSCKGGGCAGEFEDWLECFLAFCSEHPDNSGC